MDNNELIHYGVPGMRWGVRKQRSISAKKQYRNSVNKAFDEYERTISDIEKSYKRGQTLSKKDLDREAAAEKKYRDAVNVAKQTLSESKKQSTKGSKVAKRVLIGVGALGVATAATAAVTRRAAMNYTVLGMFR